MARPVKERDRRDNRTTIRFTDDEERAILFHLRECDFTKVEMIRLAVVQYLERAKNRTLKRSHTPQETRFSRTLYREVERVGRKVNGRAFAFNSRPDKPPHAQHMAFMLDDVTALIRQLVNQWPCKFVYDFKLWDGVQGIGVNLGQIMHNYRLLEMDYPKNLADTGELVMDIADRMVAAKT